MGETRQSFVRGSIVARSAELIDQYADSDIGFVDTSIVAVAERLTITRILTLDRRHYAAPATLCVLHARPCVGDARRRSQSQVPMPPGASAPAAGPGG